MFLKLKEGKETNCMLFLEYTGNLLSRWNSCVFRARSLCFLGLRCPCLALLGSLLDSQISDCHFLFSYLQKPPTAKEQEKGHMETESLLNFCIFIITNRETVDSPIILRVSYFYSLLTRTLGFIFSRDCEQIEILLVSNTTIFYHANLTELKVRFRLCIHCLG